MRMPWQGMAGLAKAIAILCTIFIISLGLCGLNVAVSRFITGDGSALIATGILEGFGMLVSVLGLLIVAVIVIARAIRNTLFPNRDQERGK